MKIYDKINNQIEFYSTNKTKLSIKESFLRTKHYCFRSNFHKFAFDTTSKSLLSMTLFYVYTLSNVPTENRANILQGHK